MSFSEVLWIAQKKNPRVAANAAKKYMSRIRSKISESDISPIGLELITIIAQCYVWQTFWRKDVHYYLCPYALTHQRTQNVIKYIESSAQRKHKCTKYREKVLCNLNVYISVYVNGDLIKRFNKFKISHCQNTSFLYYRALTCSCGWLMIFLLTI